MPSTLSLLSVTDVRTVARLRRRERLWPRQRWAVLAIAVSWIVVGVYVEVGALHTLRDAAFSFSTSSSAVDRSFNGGAVFLSCLATKNAVIGELLRWAGILVLIRVLVRWRGNAVDRLVLALLPPEAATVDGNTSPA